MATQIHHPTVVEPTTAPLTADRCQPPPTAIGHATPPSNGCLANSRSFDRWPPPAAADRRRPLKSSIQRSFVRQPLVSPLAAASRRRPPPATQVHHHPTGRLASDRSSMTAGRRQPPPTAAGHSSPPSYGCLANSRSFTRWPPPAAADRRRSPKSTSQRLLSQQPLFQPLPAASRRRPPAAAASRRRQPASQPPARLTRDAVARQPAEHRPEAAGRLDTDPRPTNPFLKQLHLCKKAWGPNPCP